MPQSIPAGLTREHVLLALANLDAGVPHPFGDPTKYELVYQGRRYAPKAVIGLACFHSLGRALRPDEFSGGEAPGQANFVLRQLGFTVVNKNEEPPVSREDWSESEVALVVSDYFAMLTRELLGQPYSKTDHRNALRPLLANRSDGSIEFKHQNISAVLVRLGLPYIEGYKPRGNLQGLLALAVESYLATRPGYLVELADSPAVRADKPVTPEGDPKDIFVPPPDVILATEPAKPWLTKKVRRIDFAERDAANRELAKLGERFVVELERLRLRRAGRDDLAGKVEHVSETVGDGLGYDVHSFEEVDGSDRLVEVKTTGLGIFFPFYVTANEARCSEDMEDRYYLYRVFDFSRGPKVYVLKGALSKTCQLRATQFLATRKLEGDG